MKEIVELLTAFSNRVKERFPGTEYSFELGDRAEDKMHLLELKYQDIVLRALYCTCGKIDPCHKTVHRGWCGVELLELPHREVELGFGIVADIPCDTEEKMLNGVSDIFQNPEKY